MSKHYILAITTLLAIAPGSETQAQRGYSRAQYGLLDEARALAEAGQWNDAYRIYKRLAHVDTTFAEPWYGLGLCAANLPGQRQQAAAHFEAAARHGSTEGLYQLALARHRQGRFQEEAALLERYRHSAGREVPNAEVDRQMEIAGRAQAFTADPVRVLIRNLGPNINSPAHDYSPLVTADGNTLYFTSRRPGTMGGLKDQAGQSYEDIFTSTRTDETWDRATSLAAPVNSNMQDATVGLSPDGNEMIIYRASMQQPDGDLFITERAQGAWSEPMRMAEQINSAAHEPSATISPDGTEIYFTSDRPGGFGGRDLYRIRRLPDGQWSLALNLGPEINTPYDEDAPFLHSDGTTLFFSSNGHNTMGGFDIYKATLLNPDLNEWGKPENMGYPVNTVDDDIYFNLDADGRTGYFSSEREGGLGGQDIYQVTFPTSQVEYLLVHGVVTDGNEAPLKAHIALTDTKTGEVAGIYNTNPRTGRYLMAVHPDRTYRIKVTSDGFTPTEHGLQATDEELTGALQLDITLAPAEKTAGALLNQ